MDEGGPVEVWTAGEPFDSRTGQGPTVMMRYANGVIMDASTGRGGAPKFVGENGSVTVDDREGKLIGDPPELVAEPLEDLDPQAPRGASHYAHCRNWLDCIRQRRKPNADVEIGHRSTIVSHLGNIAYKTGRKLVYGICLFTDAKGYTGVSETMNPEELSSYMNQYFEKIFAPVKKNSEIGLEIKAD